MSANAEKQVIAVTNGLRRITTVFSGDNDVSDEALSETKPDAP